MEQIGIAMFGVAAIFLVSRREHWRRWGYIMGICSQPFWFITSWKNEQWGIFALSFFYAFSWAQGVWNFWLSPKARAETKARRAQHAARERKP